MFVHACMHVSTLSAWVLRSLACMLSLSLARYMSFCLSVCLSHIHSFCLFLYILYISLPFASHLFISLCLSDTRSLCLSLSLYTFRYDAIILYCQSKSEIRLASQEAVQTSQARHQDRTSKTGHHNYIKHCSNRWQHLRPIRVHLVWDLVPGSVLGLTGEGVLQSKLSEWWNPISNLSMF